MGLFDKQQTNRSGGLFGSSPSPNEAYDITNLEKQIANAKTRIQASGYEVKEDKRNWFEKATNLPEGQNALFDALELLDRPGNAIRNALHKDGDNLNELARGFSGKDKVRGTDLVGDSIENKYGKAVAGFGLELLTDPTMLIPGGAIVKGVSKGAGAVGNVGGAAVKALPGSDKLIEALTPMAKGTKDTLGHMFNTRYGRDMKFDESGNLVKGEDNLTPLMQNTESKIRYQNMQNEKNIIDAAKLAGGYEKGELVGRVMEDPLKQFDELGSEIVRNKKPLPQEKEIQEAANRLVQSNNVLRQQAEELGIGINELEGYMRHILSKEEVKLRKTKGQSVYGIDKGKFGIGNPNDKFLKSRQLTGSAEEINEQLGRKMFEPNAFFSTAYGQKQLTEYMHAVDFRRKVLSNPEMAIKYQKGMNVPDGAVKIDTKNYQFLRDDDIAALGLKDEIGGEYVVPNAVKNALDRYQNMVSDEGIKGFLKTFDTTQSWWKRAALFSIPYHLRNDVGAKFNNYVGGMEATDIAKYSAKADKEVFDAMVLGKPSKEYDEYLQQGLGASSQSKIEFKQYGEDTAKELERVIKEGSKGVGGQIATRLNPLRAFETSREFGDFVDQTNRFALYRWAREKKGMSPEQAAQKVREVQFDYTDLTAFEREFATRAIPFYRWMRNNIPFQLRSFANDPRNYIRADKARLSAQEAMGIDQENVPEWMKQSFAIPVTGDGKGSGKFISMNLPLGDLTRLAEPGKMLVDGLSPLAKLPVELTMNRNFFYDKPIEQFEGQQKQLKIPGTNVDFGLPMKPAYALENLTGQIGRNLSQYLQKPDSVDQDTKFRTPSLGISSVMKDYDVNQAKFFQLLEDLKRLRERMDLIEQQTGKRPPTMADLKK